MVSDVSNVTLSNGFNPGSIATSESATIFTLDGGVGDWTIKNGDDKLGFWIDF